MQEFSRERIRRELPQRGHYKGIMDGRDGTIKA
jgi:hypothetical protein